jgi:hypothetical protein
MACKAVDFVIKAPIKNKKAKAQIVAQYTEVLAFARKQLTRIEEAYTAQRVFSAQQNALIDYCTELHEYMPSERIAHRLELLHTIDLTQPTITTKQYTVSETVTSALAAFDCDITQLRTHIGNAYQQLLHQELLTIAETATHINQGSPLFFQQETFFACAASAFEYNKVGSAYEATQIADFCWALLDYGGAVLEGAITGASAALLYATTHPFETTATVFAGQYILAYQLSRLLYDVAKISLTATYDADAASQEWETLTQPITDLYDALTAAEVTVRDKIKMASTIATSFYAQAKLIGGLQKFCGGMLKQVNFFRQNNPPATPQEYLATTESLLYKASIDTTSGGQKPSMLPTLSNIKEEVFNKALEHATTDTKLIHFFDKPMHRFDQLLLKFGNNQKALVCKILRTLYNSTDLPPNGIHKEVFIELEGYLICARVFLDDNVIKIGTMFIP